MSKKVCITFKNEGYWYYIDERKVPNEISNEFDSNVQGSSDRNLLENPKSDSEESDFNDQPNDEDIWESHYARRCFETLEMWNFLLL